MGLCVMKPDSLHRREYLSYPTVYPAVYAPMLDFNPLTYSTRDLTVLHDWQERSFSYTGQPPVRDVRQARARIIT